MPKQKLKKIPGIDPIDAKRKKQKEVIDKARRLKKQKAKKEKLENLKEKFQNINYKKILVILAIFIILLGIIFKLLNNKIKNIEVIGNNILSEQEIIDLAGIRNYPNSISNSSSKIKKRLEENVYIDYANVKKSNFLTKVTIEIKEKRPLFYYSINSMTALSDGSFVEKEFNVPTLVNQVPEDILNNFSKTLDKVNDEILIRINEIKYVPNEVDDTLFLFSMSDQNYIYVNIKNLSKLNEYLNMLKTFNNKKGILHLDSGDYFEIVDPIIENEEVEE